MISSKMFVFRIEFNTINSMRKCNASTVIKLRRNHFWNKNVSTVKEKWEMLKSQNNNVRITKAKAQQPNTGKHMEIKCNWFVWKVCRLDIHYSFRITNNQIMNKCTNCTSVHRLPNVANVANTILTKDENFNLYRPPFYDLGFFWIFGNDIIVVQYIQHYHLYCISSFFDALLPDVATPSFSIFYLYWWQQTYKWMAK